MSPQPASLPDAPQRTTRKILLLGWTSTGMKALEAVEERRGAEAAYYWQVTRDGKAVLQTLVLTEAQAKYDSLK